MSRTSKYAGRILIYSTPAALTQHIEWAINQKLGQVVTLTWVNQPLSPSNLATEFEYKHDAPVAAAVASALKGWHFIRFEITQVNSITNDVIFYRSTPELGLHQASLTTNGDVVINENQLNTILKNSYTHEKLITNIENALGSAWEAELEPYRIALNAGINNFVSKIG